MNNEKLLSVIDHTCLDSTLPWEGVKKEAEFALKNSCASFCVAPYYISRLKKQFKDLKLCSVIGFPRGDCTTATKVFETKDAIANGAEEIDMVANISAIKSGDFEAVEKDLAEVRKACTVTLKVIVETYYLNDDELSQMTKLVGKIKADYIKTCTGNIDGGASVHAVEVILKNMPKGLKLKVSGGMTTREKVEMFIEMGADRIGTKFTQSFI